MMNVASLLTYMALASSCNLRTHGLQSTPSFPQTPPGSSRPGRRQRVPSSIHFLDDGYFTHASENSQEGSSSVEVSDEVMMDALQGSIRTVTAKIHTNINRGRKYNASVLGSLVKEDCSQRQRRSLPRRKKLVPRSTIGAILPSSTTRKSRALKSSCTRSSELLTAEDEKEIAGHIRSFRAAMRARDKLVEWMTREVDRMGASQLTEPSEDQWASACSLSVEQLQHVIVKGQEARTKLITGNVGLVTMIAKRYYGILRNGAGKVHGSGVGGTDATLKLDDLIQEGYMGIMEAAERFDPSKGFRFSTYATHWIRQRIVRSIAESSRMIRLPMHVQTMIRTMNKKQKQMEEAIGRTPSMPELAHEMGVALDKLQLYHHLSRRVVSLELPVDTNSPEDKRTLGDRIACTEVPTPDEDAMSEALRGEVHAMLDALDTKERLVVTRRFGLDDGRPKTLKETAQGLGISSDSVRAVEAKALNKLRQPRMNYRLKDYVKGMGDLDGGVEEKKHSKSPKLVKFNGFGKDRKEEDRPTPESIWSF